MTHNDNVFDYDFIDVPADLAETLMGFGDGRESANILSNKIDTAGYAASREKGYLPYASLESHRLGTLTEGALALAFGLDPLSLDYVAADRYSKVNDADVFFNGTLYEVRNTTSYGTQGVSLKQKDARVNAIVISVYAEADADGKNPTGRVYFKGWANAFRAWDSLGTSVKGNGRLAVGWPMSLLNGWDSAHVNHVAVAA